MTTAATAEPTWLTVFELRQALIQQRAWVQHWQEDLASNLKPTPESMESAVTSIDAALGNGESA
jgi:hypothetical protein